MIVKEELDHQQQINVNQQKLIYSPPIFIVLGVMEEVKGGNIGISEHICGCGIGS